MAWGGGAGGAVGGMGGMGGGGPGRGFAAARPEGLPFAGIPPEMAAMVAELVATETERPDPEVTFTHRIADRRRLTIRRMLASHLRAVALCVLVVVIEVASLQSGPYLTQLGIDKGILAHSLGTLLTVGLAYVVLIVIGSLTSAARVALAGRVSARVNTELRVRVFAHLQRLSLDFFTDTKAGVVMTRMTSDIEALQQLFQDGLVQFLIQGLTMVLVTAILFADNVRLAVITVALIVPVLTALSLWFRAASDRAYSRVRDGIANVLSDLSESLSGLRVVTAFNRQWRNIVHHRNVVGEYQEAYNHSARLVANYGATTDFLGFLGQAAVLLIGGHMVLSHQLTVGELTAFVLYLSSFFTPIQALVQQYNVYQQGQAAVFKLAELLATEPSVPEAPDARPLPRIRGDIVLDHVTFGYDPAGPVLSDVDLRISPGETVAIVGETGAGKSTIAKLITRFYDPTGGRVMVDGHDLRTVTLRSLRTQLGVVPQEPYLFEGTIRDNIAFSRPSATDTDVDRAAAQTGLDELLARLPDGIDTYVHERGVSLSSGQRQMVALARAFLAQPRILVLDEATSNLDMHIEDRVEAAFDVLLEGRTAVIIAHRLSTAMKADRIVVVDDGRIVEEGTHDELVARGGRYAALHAAWEHRMGADLVRESNISA